MDGTEKLNDSLEFASRDSRLREQKWALKVLEDSLLVTHILHFYFCACIEYDFRINFTVIKVICIIVLSVQREKTRCRLRQFTLNVKDAKVEKAEKERKMKMQVKGLHLMKSIFKRIKNTAKAKCLEAWVLNTSEAMEDDEEDDEDGLIKVMQVFLSLSHKN